MSSTFLPLVTEPEQLEAASDSDNLVAIHISKPERYAGFHVPGAIHLQGGQFVRVEKPLLGLLPHARDFQQLLEASGISPETHVVAYDDEGGGWARGGHIPGAQLLNWVDTMDRHRNLRFKPEDELRAMLEQRGITPDREVLCYCQSHHRSSHSYIMLKSPGYPRVKGYPGAWSDWGNRVDTPIE